MSGSACLLVCLASSARAVAWGLLLLPGPSPGVSCSSPGPSAGVSCSSRAVGLGSPGVSCSFPGRRLGSPAPPLRFPAGLSGYQPTCP
ncbi:unnamed protein product [Arctogadus glacialis]